MGIEGRKLDFYGNFGYYDVFMEKLAILKFTWVHYIFSINFLSTNNQMQPQFHFEYAMHLAGLAVFFAPSSSQIEN